MTNQHHTPGPWRVNDWSVKGWSIASNVGLHIASKSYVNELTGQAYRDEMLKNAHLIAAAPELLAALEGLYGLWQGDYDSPQNIAARNAIKKAKGELE